MKIFTLFIFLFSLQVEAIELSRTQKLKKMSYILTSSPARQYENDELLNLSESELEAFYSDKIDEYIQGDRFEETFRARFLNLFQMYFDGDTDFNGTDEKFWRNENAFDHLVRRVLRENLPWRELILSQEYDSTIGETLRDGGDLQFFQFVFYKELGEEFQDFVQRREFQNPSYGGDLPVIPLKAATPQQKQTLAGIITTQRFFSRYQTTKVNKDRRRAAALFRTLLCDPMKPIVLVNKEEDQELLKQSLQMKKAHLTGTVDLPLDSEALHGSDPQCMACHYKLDPMAKVFAGSGVVLNAFASPGALVFKNEEGERVHEEVLGFKELAEAIVSQKDYSSCQVSHFWKWVIGEDIPLSDAVKDELVTEFNRVDQRPKDFIKYLIQRDEFYQYEALQDTDIRFSHVRPIFKRCDSCHQSEGWAPNLSDEYPYDNNFYVTKFPLVEQIAVETDLGNHGQAANMPPKKAGWSLQPNERDLILAWIKSGAKDDAGKVHMTSGLVFNSLQDIEYEEGFSSRLEPTFFSTFTRVLNGEELVQTLMIKFNISQSYNYGGLCNTNDATSRRSAGYPESINGLPLFKYPTPNYLKWWMGCIDRNRQNIMNYYSEKLQDLADGDLTQSWLNMDLEKRKIIFNAVVEHLLGPESISEEARERLFNRVNQQVTMNGKPVSDVILDSAAMLMMTKTFLTY